MLYRYQTFRFPFEDQNDVVIRINPRLHVARVIDPSGNRADKLLRQILEENKWTVHTVAQSTTLDNPWLVAMCRGEALLTYLREEGTHNDTVLHLLPKEEQEAIKKNRERRLFDEANERALQMIKKTYGAGVIIYCLATNRFLLCIRGKNAPDAGQYAMFGGKLNFGEAPRVGAVRELSEEAGIDLSNPEKLFPLWIYEDDSLVYHNFLLLVNDEFECRVNPDEIEDYRWVPYGEFSKLPIHSGVKKLFESDRALKSILAARAGSETNYSQIVDSIMDDIFGRKKPNGDDEPPPMAA